jgi:predicted AlkP superfamily pyrophosphatase or phosphodiesterase
MESVDSQGHNYGPNSPYVGDAIYQVDSAIKELINGVC